MLRRPPGVGVDCTHATPTGQKEKFEVPLHPDTHPLRAQRRCACTVRGGGACEQKSASGIPCAALAGMLHGRALTGTGTSVVPGIATRSLPHAATPRRGSVRVQGQSSFVCFTAAEMDGTMGARRQRRGVLASKTARSRGRAPRVRVPPAWQLRGNFE